MATHTLSGDVIAAIPATHWTQWGHGFQAASYWKDPHGIIRFRGVLQGDSGVTTGAFMFGLSSGYRPAATEMFAVWNAQAAAAVRIDVDQGGNVWWRGPAGACVVSLSGIQFLAGT